MLKQSPSRRGPIGRCAAAVVGTAMGVLMVAGCAAGQDAQTVGQRPPIDGASAASGDIAVRAAAVLPPGGASYPKGSTASLQLVLINTGNSSETLTSISSPVASGAQLSQSGTSPAGSTAPAAGDTSASGPASASPTGTGTGTGTAAGASGSASASDSGATASSPASQPISIPAGGSVKIGYGSDGPSASLTGLTAELFPAQSVTVTLTFGSGATVAITLPVMLSSQAPSAPVVSDATEPTG